MPESVAATWSFNVRHEGTGNDCYKGRHFAMTKSIWPHRTYAACDWAQAGASVTTCRQSHAGLSVQIESSMTENKHLAAQAASSDLCPSPREERGTPVARSQF